MSDIPNFALEQAARYTEEFVKKFPEKFLAGQKNHGGNLEQTFELKVLEHAKEEVLDQWSYLCALDTLINGLMECLDEMDTDLWNARKRITELEQQLEDKPDLLMILTEDEYVDLDGLLNELSLA